MPTNPTIPTGWKEMKLGDEVKIYGGGTFSSKDAKESGAKWLKIANVGIGEIKWEEKSYLPITFLDEYKNYVLREGDIVIALTRPTLGNKLKIAKIYEEDSNSLLNQRVGKLLTSENINKEFAYYILRMDSSAYRLNQQLYGTDPPNLSSKAFNYIPLLLPPLPEQNRIVAVLEAWDKAIEKLTRKIEVKKSVKKGLMQKLLTGQVRLPGFNEAWKEVQLGNVCNISKGVQFNKEYLDDFGDYPCVNGGIEPSGYTDKYNAEKNTITISEGGNSCGYVNFLVKDFWCGGHCYAIKNVKIDNHFLYQILKLSEKRIMSLRVGSGLPNIQKKSLDHLKLKIPKSNEEQTAIADVLTTSDKEIEVLEKKLSLLENQKKFLLNKLITGKIRVPEQ